MAYRESAANEETRFSDAQRRWIDATASEAVVRRNLAGKDALAGPPRAPPDHVGEVMLWSGLAFTGLGGIAAFATASMLSAVAIVPGILVAGSAVHRLRRAPVPPFSIDIVTVQPKFETRPATDKDGGSETITYLVTPSNDAIAWPRTLEPLTKELREETHLRIGLVRRGGNRYVGWAYPVAA